ncbi:MAG: Transcriptional regulator [Gammaproteobacteria bacterium]|jgi:DNA-binding transcriptional LysR family regulator|nr:Transcriptional regulator [Gammaproteobacteria bacterium]
MNQSLSIEHLPEIRTFILVADSESFTRAAQILEVSPTAVSKQIKKLENAIQEDLFIRTTRQVRLTEFGSQLYHAAKGLQSQWDNVQSLILSKDKCPKGTLKIASSLVVANRFIIPNLLEFRERYTNLNIELKLAERIPDMNREDIDILVGFSATHNLPQNLKAKKLFDSRVILVASPSYLEKYGCPKKEKDLLRHQFISHALRSTDNEFSLMNKKSLKFAKPVIVVNALESMLELCVKGNGIALIGETLAKKYLEKGELVRILPNLPYPSHIVCLYYQPLAHQQAKIRYFIDFLLSKISFE